MNLDRTVIDILSDLIKVESETDNEKELCDLISNTLSSYSGELIRHGNSLIYNLNLGKERRVALVGHIDTVPVDKSSTEPVIKNGELWGRGACDMKSGLACMLKMIHDISSGQVPKYNISFVFYEGEEGPIPNGINKLIDNGLLNNIDFAYILEPTEGKYSVGCLGSLAVKKEVYGVSAHSANPKTGKNALDETMEVYNRIREMNNYISDAADIDGLQFYETVNVTTMETSNKAFNVIPSKTEMIVNYRFSPERTSKEAMELLLKYYGKEGITLLDEADSCYIGNDHDGFLLDGIDREIMQAWTDIAQLNKAGIPAVNFGAGSIKHAHKPDERICIAELESFYSLLIRHIM